MKKIVTMLIAALVLSFSLSMATPALMGEDAKTIEVNGVFKVDVVVPDGYTYMDNWVNPTLYLASLTPDDAQKPFLMLSIALSEIYQGRTINEFTKEELNNLIAVYQEHYDEPESSIKETGLGTKLVVLKEKSEADPHVEVISVYKGYEVSVLLVPHVSETAITDGDIQFAIDFLTEMKITD